MKVVVLALVPPPDTAKPAFAAPTAIGSAVLTALALATVILGFYQEPLTRWLMQ